MGRFKEKPHIENSSEAVGGNHICMVKKKIPFEYKKIKKTFFILPRQTKHCFPNSNGAHNKKQRPQASGGAAILAWLVKYSLFFPTWR